MNKKAKVLAILSPAPYLFLAVVIYLGLKLPLVFLLLLVVAIFFFSFRLQKAFLEAEKEVYYKQHELGYMPVKKEWPMVIAICLVMFVSLANPLTIMHLFNPYHDHETLGWAMQIEIITMIYGGVFLLSMSRKYTKYVVVEIPIFEYDIEGKGSKKKQIRSVEVMIYGDKNSPDNQILARRNYLRAINELKEEATKRAIKQAREKAEWEAGKEERERLQAEEKENENKCYEENEWTPFKRAISQI